MLDFEALSEALAAVHVGVWSWAIDDNSILWSPELCAIFGRPVGAPPPTYEDYLALVPPTERDGVRATIATALQDAAATGSSTSYTVVHRIILADGVVRWIEGRGKVVVDSAGRPRVVTGTAIDISARKLAEAKATASEEAARLFTELATDYVYAVDYRNPTLFPEIVAGSFERTTGLTPATVEAKGGWWQVVHPLDRAALADMVPLLKQGKPAVNEYRITDGAGQVRWLRDAIRPVLDPATGEVVKLMGGVQDITERKRLEHQLLQAQKLEAVARLSGGIAHDFNNLLAVVMASVELLRRQITTVAARESCDAIMEAAKRGAELTRSLLVFSRRDSGTAELVELAEVARRAVPMLTRAVGLNVSIKVTCEGPPGHVRIDPGQAQLLLLNLVVNARDAMPQGGAIDIDIRPGAYAASDGLPAELAPGAYVRLSVTDQGCGIDPEVMHRVFEPFFTTKAHGQGTGLGLAACHGIVQNARGAIQVDSVIDQGTTFSIYLPWFVGASTAEPSPVRVSAGGTESVLVVEDEPLLRQIFARALEEHGYAVLTADSAEAALTLLETHAVTLIVSDVVLPGLRGTELVARARARWPKMKVLLISGYAGASERPEGVPVLAKPFTVDRLAGRVRSVLDGTDGDDGDDGTDDR